MLTHFTSDWLPAEYGPPVAGRFLVASAADQEVGVARWKPRKGEWVFPSAHLRLQVTHWMPLPPPPEAE